jgi:hypothetical protein
LDSPIKKEGKITDELIRKLMAWRHSGFSIDNGVRIKREDTKGREAIAQYISTGYYGIIFPCHECGYEDWTIAFRIRGKT